ncbi:hypothetical protein [Rhodococcus opacus]|uniref:hypothetical protein n=1 Tax=Rhodococcus opacus TaxID=37919 RepID=UPI0002E3AB90|nr:hypothetical protein [Rhodococcus opacus]
MFVGVVVVIFSMTGVEVVTIAAAESAPVTDRSDQLGVDQAQAVLAGVGSVDTESDGNLADPARAVIV